jgi:hypothetical protein
MGQEPVHGNLSHAMRDNYAEHGVDQVCQNTPARARACIGFTDYLVLSKSSFNIS